MTRKERRLINKLNALRSTGPKSSAGKETSSLNATTHGLTSKRIVLPHESQADFDTLRDALHSKHKPAGEVEKQLVEQVAQTWWRLQRAYRVEAAFLARQESDDAIVDMFLNPAQCKQMQLMMRYLAAAERAWNKALSELRRVQTERRKQEAAENALAGPAASAQPPQTTTTCTQTGFVSHLHADIDAVLAEIDEYSEEAA